MARVNSPTQNLYALLAEPEPAEATRPSKVQAAKRPQGKEETPAARAARNAVEKDAKLAQKKAEREKVKQAAEEAERFKQAAAEFDDTGFTQQRLQRVKQAKATKVVPKGEAQAFPKGNKGEKGDFKPKQKKTFSKEGQVGGPLNVATDSQKKDGGKTKPANKPARFDKHSNNPKTSKKPIATKDGAGKANWGKAPSPQGTAEATVAAAAGTTDEWDEVGVTAAATPTTEAAAPAAESEVPEAEAVDEKKKSKEEWDEEDAKLLTLDSYLAIKAEKQKALEALVGADKAQPRALTEEEKNQQAKFTLLANEKNKKAEGTPAATAGATAKIASNANARKGEKPIAVDQVFRIRDNRPRGRGGRPDRPRNIAEGETKTEAPASTATRGAGRGRGGGRGGKRNQPYAEAYPQLGSPLKA